MQYDNRWTKQYYVASSTVIGNFLLFSACKSTTSRWAPRYDVAAARQYHPDTETCHSTQVKQIVVNKIVCCDFVQNEPLNIELITSIGHWFCDFIVLSAFQLCQIWPSHITDRSPCFCGILRQALVTSAKWRL